MGLLADIERCAHLIARHWETTAGDVGVTQAEAHVLAQLARHGSVPIGLLHDRFGHKRSTLTNVLDRLEARGFVRREVNAGDRRSFVVSLSAAGRPVAARVTKVQDALERELGARLDQDTIHAVASVAAALDSVLGVGGTDGSITRELDRERAAASVDS
jgi:MarR family 2-MHQ and catechol resistance regulon transcriptional repressor